MTLNDIEALANAYAQAYQSLAERLDALNAGISALKTSALGPIRESAAEAAEAKKALMIAIQGSAHLFEKPRTRLFHGVKCGLTKRKGRVEWEDEGKVIERIRAQLPPDQVELLLTTETHVHKPGVYDLAVADLKRLGIKIVDDDDAVVTKIAGTEIENLVNALLAEVSEVDE